MFLGISAVLIVLEIFIPSGGVLGGLSALALLAAIVAAFFVSATTGWITLTATILIVPILVWLFFRYWPTTTMGKNFVMAPQEKELLVDEQRMTLNKLVGRQGIAQSDMLLSGSVMIDRHLFSAVSEGLPIEQGTPVEVVGVRMHTLVVRKLEGEWSEKSGMDGSKNSVADETPAAETDDEMLSRPIDSLGFSDLDDLLDE